jgi:hypothetical protein
MPQKIIINNNNSEVLSIDGITDEKPANHSTNFSPKHSGSKVEAKGRLHSPNGSNQN